MKKGDRVRMAEAAKARMRADIDDPQYTATSKVLMEDGRRQHVEEFGECIGVVMGPMFPGSDAPEVDVRWEPSGLRYGYDPSELELVADDEAKR